MKKTSIILIFLTCLLGLNCFSQTIKSDQIEYSEDIVDIFKTAIELNENLKQGIVNKSQTVLHEERKKMERYFEELVLPSIDKCLEKLSLENDEKLANSLLHLVLSYNNSADEKLMESLSQLFINNSELFLKTFSKFNLSQRKYLFEMLNIGWQNYIYDKSITEKQLLDLQMKIDELHFSVTH